MPIVQFGTDIQTAQ